MGKLLFMLRNSSPWSMYVSCRSTKIETLAFYLFVRKTWKIRSWIKLINIDPSMLNYPSPMIVSPRPRITTPNKRSASAGAQLQYTNTWQLECKCWHTDYWHLAIGVQVPLSQSKVYWYFWHLECKAGTVTVNWYLVTGVQVLTLGLLTLGKWSASVGTQLKHTDICHLECKYWGSVTVYWPFQHFRS